MKEADTMPYIYREYRAGQTVEVYKTYSARYGKNLPRGPNCNPTPEAVKKSNERIAEMKLRLLLNENFKAGDLHCVLTYRDPPDSQQAKTELAKFFRVLRRKYKEQDIELKYVAVTEQKGRIHHHIIVNSIDPRIIQEVWKNGIVRPVCLYGNDFVKLAAYLLKEVNKTFREADAPSRKRWNQSKNLRQPKVIVRVISAKRWQQEPEGRKGFILITDSIVNDVSAFGIPYQHYRMVAVTEKRRN